MAKKYNEIHIYATNKTHKRKNGTMDFYYRNMVEKPLGVFNQVGQPFKSRSAASRAANKISKKINHWYLI